MLKHLSWQETSVQKNKYIYIFFYKSTYIIYQQTFCQMFNQWHTMKIDGRKSESNAEQITLMKFQ